MVRPDHEIPTEDIPLEPWAFVLPPKDREFVREFLIDLNAMQALIRCGHSEINAKRHCTRQMRRPAIARAIAQAMHERAEALGITAKTVLGEAFRCYLLAIQDKSYTAAARFLDMVGRHVDVQAFRNRYAPGMEDEDDEAAASGLRNLTIEEIEELARLSRKAAGEPEGLSAPSALRDRAGVGTAESGS